MMKKVFAVVCTLALAGGVIAGCSGNSDNAEKKSDSAATEQKAAATDEVKAPESDVAMKYIIYNKFPYIGFLSKKVVYLQ